MGHTRRVNESIETRERGTCPRCGGPDVRHIVYGLRVTFGDAVPDPEWIVNRGCMALDHDRECEACGHAWASD